MARLQKHPDDEADGDEEDEDDDGADLPWPEVVLPPPLRHLHQGEKEADEAPANKKSQTLLIFLQLHSQQRIFDKIMLRLPPAR